MACLRPNSTSFAVVEQKSAVLSIAQIVRNALSSDFASKLGTLITKKTMWNVPFELGLQGIAILLQILLEEFI